MTKKELEKIISILAKIIDKQAMEIKEYEKKLSKL